MTRAEAIKQVLQNLRVLDGTDNPSAEDALLVGQRLDQEHDRLKEIGLVWWDVDDIPASVSAAFCRMVAAQSSDAFGKQYDATGSQAMIAAVKSSSRREVVQTDYF